MTSLEPRLVLVTRRSEYEQLLATHATRSQAQFYLEQRGQNLKAVETIHQAQHAAIIRVRQAEPDDWSLAEVRREDLDRFLFADGDIVIAIGQDGLVANLAKYLSGQLVVGVTPDPDRTEGVLTPLSVDVLTRLLPDIAAGEVEIESRTMVQARLDDGQCLSALNELFVGHRSHQSARYLVRFDAAEEYQSSSGLIISTGTGLTGWARSIMTATNRTVAFTPEALRAVFFAREPWPSRTSGCELAFGEISPSRSLAVTSRMDNGGVIFADGIEQDFLRFDWGSNVEIGLSKKTLNLVRAS